MTSTSTMTDLNVATLTKLASLLARGGEEAEGAAGDLRRMCLGRAARHAALHAGAVPAMLPYMLPDTPAALLRPITQAFSSLCRADDEAAVELELVAPALPLIKDLLGGGNQQILEAACTAVTNIVCGVCERIEAAQEVPGLLERLVALLAHEAAGVKAAAVAAVLSMMSGNTTQVDRCLDAGCLPPIVALLRCSEPSLVESAARALVAILARTHTAQQALDLDILTPLKSILANGEVECQNAAAKALASLCLRGSAAHRGQLVSSGVLQPYSALLARPDLQLQMLVLIGIDALVQGAQGDDSTSPVDEDKEKAKDKVEDKDEAKDKDEDKAKDKDNDEDKAKDKDEDKAKDKDDDEDDNEYEYEYEVAIKKLKVETLCLKLVEHGVFGQLQKLLQKQDIDVNVRRVAMELTTTLRFYARGEDLIYEDGKVFSPKEIIQELKSRDLAAQMRAARAAQRLLRRAKGTMREGDIRHIMTWQGGFEAFGAALENDTTELQLEVLSALTILTDGQVNCLDWALKDGLACKLVALLGKTGEVPALAAIVLGNFASTGPMERNIVLSLGAVPAMVPRMRPDTPTIELRLYLRAYQKFCKFFTEYNPVPLELVAPALPCVSELLAVDDLDVLENACKALDILLKTSKEAVEAAQAAPRLTARLVALLGHENDKIKAAAFKGVIWMLSYIHQVDPCLDAGLLDHVSVLIQCSDPVLVEYAIGAVYYVFNSPPANIQRALDKDILAPLRKILDMDMDTSDNGTRAITMFCFWGSDEQHVQLVESGALQSYVRQLARPNSSNTLVDIMNGLQTLVKRAPDSVYEKPLRSLLTDLNFKELLRPLLNHGDEEVKMYASELLKLVSKL